LLGSMWHVHWASLVGTVGTVLVLLSEGLVVDSCYWKLYCWDGYRGSHNEDTALISYYNLCPISPQHVMADALWQQKNVTYSRSLDH